MKKYINFEKINELSKVDSTVPLYQKMIKLSEEAGEISDAIDTAKDNVDIKEIVEETCDTINVAVDIINALNETNDIDNIYEIDMNTDMLINDADTYSLPQICNRINSEVGKCSQEFLRFDGAKNVSKSANDGKQSLLKQVNSVIKWCDIAITSIEEAFVEITEDFVIEMFNNKLSKWESKQNKYKD